MGIIRQLHRNTVALISLVIAITSLTYNTWRNEATEWNRTQRSVAIAVLMKLGDLQELTWRHHFDKDYDEEGNLRSGWTLVLVIRDISQVLDNPLPESTAQLHATWDKHSPRLDESSEAEDAIIASIEAVREDAVQLLRDLE